ncbi:Peroxidase [Bertholletia excelsa]
MSLINSFPLQAFVLLLLSSTTALSDLSPNFYDQTCPQALPTIERVVKAAVDKEKRMGASLLRLHFHDCFVNGCDGSILLDQTSTIDSEKIALPKNNSVRGFEVIDQIKEKVDKVCGQLVVSCADILAVAARDSVVALGGGGGGATWKVHLGRRDSTTASRDTANKDLPSPLMDLRNLTQSFQKQGLEVTDLVALSGAHTIGFAHCRVFKQRLSNDANIDPAFARQLRATCPPTGGDDNLAPLDPTPIAFDLSYFTNLIKKRGLLRSDQALFNGGQTDELVKSYSQSTETFSQDFANSMIKMGNIKPLTGTNGQIRLNCRKVN